MRWAGRAVDAETAARRIDDRCETVASVFDVAGAADDQECAPADLAPVDAWLAKHPWKVGFSLTTWNAVPSRERRGESSNWTIAIGTTRSHGLSDLVIARTTEPDEDGTPALSERSVLHFDGKSYGDANPGESAPLGPRPAASGVIPPA